MKKQILMIILTALPWAAAVFFYYGVCAKAFLYSVAAALLIIIGFEDAKTGEIHDIFSFLLLAAGIAAWFICPDIIHAERIAGLAVPALMMAFVNIVHKDSFGEGDILLLSAAGLLFGINMTLRALIIAFIAGGSFAAFLLIFGKARMNDSFPFGPFLCAGFLTVLFL